MRSQWMQRQVYFWKPWLWFQIRKKPGSPEMQRDKTLDVQDSVLCFTSLLFGLWGKNFLKIYRCKEISKYGTRILCCLSDVMTCDKQLLSRWRECYLLPISHEKCSWLLKYLFGNWSKVFEIADCDISMFKALGGFLFFLGFLIKSLHSALCVLGGGSLALT